MKKSKLTVIIIPDSEKKSKQFSFSPRTFLFGISIIIAIFIGLIGWGIYSVPQVVQYDDLLNKYNKIASERMEVMALMHDLQRLKQMDQMLRKTLGTELQFSPAEGLTDSTALLSPGFVDEKGFQISYIENIPSLAPIQGYVTQRIGISSLIFHKNHYGIDIAMREGAPVLTSAAGQVVFSGWTYDMGNLVIIYHGDGYFTHYGHNQRNLVEQRDFVKRGDAIALVGSTGISSGPHLHFEIWKDGKVIDPLVFFPEYKAKDVSPDSDG